MRVTGIVLILIGLVAGAVCVAALVQPVEVNQQHPMTDNVRVAHSGIVLPLVVCGAVIVLGAVVYMFGGKSYRVSNNPSVRN